MMKCIVVDDDPIFLELMVYYVSRQPSLQLMGSFSNSAEALQQIEQQPIDLVFLDIEMPGTSGMDVARGINCKSQVVFITSHDEFAVEAFSHRVTDYLMKPIDEDRFKSAVARAIELHKQKVLASEQQEIFIKIDSKYQRLACKEILSIDSDGDYVNVRTQQKSHLVSGSLNAMEKLLSEQCFMRIHRKNIVRLSAIQSLDKYDAILIDGSSIAVSRQKKAELVSRLETIR